MSTIFGLLSFSLFAFRWPQEECLCHLSTDQKWYSLPKSVGNSSEKATLWSFGSKTAICGIAFRRQWDQYKCQYQMDQWVKFNVLICISFIAFTFRPKVTIVMAKGISRKCFDISPYPTSIIIKLGKAFSMGLSIWCICSSHSYHSSDMRVKTPHVTNPLCITELAFGFGFACSVGWIFLRHYFFVSSPLAMFMLKSQPCLARWPSNKSCS